MTPKLIERLNRLEAGQAGRAGQGLASRELTQVWLRAVAIALGSYPRPRASGPLHLEDSYSDGFARALGYADHDDMEAQAEANPEEWSQRIERADAALCTRYGAGECLDPAERGHILSTAALDEWATAKSQNPDWPGADDSGTLARALTAYGVPAEFVKARLSQTECSSAYSSSQTIVS
ncbi:hypothetical protein MKK70_08010 [Methylobacterium sp. E-041]|uniref:hypothetical protein n=1 Tax=unclassified Methylobacterium TaxID=2615210 RepID=UPI001FB8CC94|nr:hypothetical protein [Methylobacterium sp. E-041]MCJ2105328.1 hypothetical protein [Methylobacterium sp. E-041]